MEQVSRVVTPGRLLQTPPHVSALRDDRLLLERFREGDPGALEVVYRVHIGRVARILRFGFDVPGRGSRVAGLSRHAAELEDLVHEVFAKAFARKARMAYDGLRDYQPYLDTITRNVLADWGRRHGREIPTAWEELVGPLEVMPVPTDNEPWADAETMQTVASFLESLPPDLRAVHEARFDRGLSQRAAAEALGLTRQVVRTLEQRLRKALARALPMS